MGIAPVTVFDSFSRALTDSWGTTDSGHTWQGTTADYDAYSSGGYGRIYVPANRATSVAYIDVPNNATQEVLVKVKWNVDTLTDHGPVVRRAASNSYYYARIQDYYHEIALNVNANGSVYELNRVTGITLNKNTYYWVRFRADSVGLKLRIWQDGTAEPSTWTITSNYFDGSNPPGAGDFGYYTKGTNSTYSVYLDTVYWYTMEDDEPGLPVTDNLTRLVTAGWGRAGTGHQWEGNLADDPTYYALSNQGAVSTSGYATLTTTNATTRNGIIGPSVADSEVVAAFYVDSTTGNPETLLGLRGAAAPSSGNYQFQGYYARLIWGSTSFTLRKVPSIGSASSQIGTTYTLAAAPAAGEKWWIKVQCQGTNVRAKAWKDGTAEPGWLIQTTDTSLTSGRSFVRLQGSGTSTTNFRIYSFSHTVITTGNQLNTGSITFSNVTDSSFTVAASYTNDNDNDSSCTIQYRAQGSDTWSNATVTTDRTNRRFTATISGLTQGTTYEVKATYADPDGVSGTNPLTTTVTTALNGIDTGSLTLTAEATSITVTASYANDADNDSSATYRYRVSPSGSWSSAAAMTANRGTKTFTATISGLANDTTYDVEVTYSDPDAVRGTNPITASVTTLGKGVRFASPTAITVLPAETSATVSVYYDLDTNNNSSIAIQYRSIREVLWTTLSDATITVDRTAKVFRAIIPGLVPNLSYQIKAVLSDPDGIVPGTDTEKTSVFTTKGLVREEDRRGKRYLFKVYDPDGVYLGTWHDAPEPNFGWHENGGITDLRVVLPRKLSNLNNDATIDFQNRVDVWAIDTTSEGLGVNLIKDSEMTLGSWTLTTDWSVDSAGGPDGSAALKFSSSATTQRTVLSETVNLDAAVPLVASIIAKARGGKLRMDLAAYDASDTLLYASPDNAETVGSDWQVLRLEWTPPAGTKYVRMRVSNIGSGTMWFDKAKILQKELLVYRGRIESYTPRVDQDGEEVEIEVLGLVSQLSDMYVRFLQYVEIQPTRDINEHPNQNKPPTDPANMMKEIIDIARKENPRCDLYYTSDSIKPTGVTVQYTFRDQQLVAAFDKIRLLCPPGWHWYVDPDGKVNLRGPEHVQTHVLRLNVEVMEYENERSIRNLKNYIIVRGRKDEDKSEPDGFGTIEHVAFDQASIAKYGLRELIIRDANIKDPETAELVAEGRLEEYNRVEEAGKAYVPDEKDARYAGGALRGYNIESFRPGDFVRIKNPISGDQRTYWDQFLWDSGTWDDNNSRVIPVDVPIKSISYNGDHVVLELSERQPSASGDFARLARWLRLQDTDTAD